MGQLEVKQVFPGIPVPCENDPFWPERGKFCVDQPKIGKPLGTLLKVGNPPEIKEIPLSTH